jgi:Xaa-Pro aminopeptidase
MAKQRKKASTSGTEIRKQRLKAVRQRLRDSKADALLITNPHDIQYLTGFSGEDSWALVPQRGGRVTILSDSRFQLQIPREAPEASAVIRKKSLSETVKQLTDRKGIERLGLMVSHVTLEQRNALKKQLGARALVELNDGMIDQRAVKDRGEINTIKQAVKLQQQAFNETLASIEPGMSEIEIAAELEYHMRSLGAEGTSFPTIVAVDSNSALPHYQPAGKKLKKGSTLLIDWGAKYKGYCADMTRTLAFGSMKPKIREIYQLVLEAQQAGIEAIGPGVSLHEVDQAARSVIEDGGYGKYFRHGLGHGIGLQVHEQPRLSAKAEGELQPGHVVTVEPGIYLPGVGGVRLEDDVAVTDRGRRVLSDLPKSLASAII